MNYYNEHDKQAAAWLRELIKAGLIPNGEVDERDIQEVRPVDVMGFTQCHFFAGIAGWSYALRLAGIPDDFPVWTGSCPCQPYSAAGRGKGDEDARNLWPDFFRLIGQCRPQLVFGEQVENAIGFGWLDGISADLEAEAYSVGAVVLGAHSVGAPHIRQRLYWMAHSGSQRAGRGLRRPGEGVGAIGERSSNQLSRSSRAGRVGNAHPARSQGRGVEAGQHAYQWAAGQAGQFGGLAHGDSERWGERRATARSEARTDAGAGRGGAWGDFTLTPCLDGKARRVKSGLQPLAHGVSGRVAKLRGIGNTIVPQVAAEFIKAAIEAIDEAL